MKEQDLNTTIKNSFLFGVKIPDPSKADVLTTSKRPFDGIGVTPNGVIFYETKLVKGYKAFPFSSIKDHQLENLTKLEDIRIKNSLKYNCYFLIGVYEPRKSLNLFCFSPAYISWRMKRGDKSISKKELLYFEDRKLFLEKTKEGYDFTRLDEVSIGEAHIL